MCHPARYIQGNKVHAAYSHVQPLYASADKTTIGAVGETNQTKKQSPSVNQTSEISHPSTALTTTHATPAATTPATTLSCCHALPSSRYSVLRTPHCSWLSAQRHDQPRGSCSLSTRDATHRCRGQPAVLLFLCSF